MRVKIPAFGWKTPKGLPRNFSHPKEIQAYITYFLIIQIPTCHTYFRCMTRKYRHKQEAKCTCSTSDRNKHRIPNTQVLHKQDIRSNCQYPKAVHQTRKVNTKTNKTHDHKESSLQCSLNQVDWLKTNARVTRKMLQMGVGLYDEVAVPQLAPMFTSPSLQLSGLLSL